MKRKAWMISALMYVMVFMICFGVLHVLRTLMEPSGPVSVESRESGGPEDTREVKTGEEWEESARPELATDSQAQEPRDEVIRQEGYKEWEKKLLGMWTPPQAPEGPYIPPRPTLATDLHYQNALAGDGGGAFRLFVERSGGKVVQYLPELLEALPDEVIEERPPALVLSGDTTMNGERLNHEELAARLKGVQGVGMQVLVIPGNHNINNHNTSVYYDTRKEPVPYISGPEFHEIYREYGYDQVLSRDDSSPSYVHALDDKNWLLMLDSCQYEPDNKVEGRLKDSTMAWADEQLARTKEGGVFVIPIAHHNLLTQSRMYITQCAMDNNKEVIPLLQKYELPLLFSEHLHVQRTREHKNEPGVPEGNYGIQEIVTDALSIPPCRYGEVLREEDGSVSYATRAVDVSIWAQKNGSINPDLLDSEDWSYRHIQKLISDQVRGVVKNLGADVEHSMAATYARVYIDYYAGREIDVKGVENTKGYRFWGRSMSDSYLIRELDAMIADLDRGNNYFLLSKEEGWITRDQAGSMDHGPEMRYQIN